MLAMIGYGWASEILHQKDGWKPINNGINHLSTGAGFLPSTVGYGYGYGNNNTVTAFEYLEGGPDHAVPDGSMKYKFCLYIQMAVVIFRIRIFKV